MHSSKGSQLSHFFHQKELLAFGFMLTECPVLVLPLPLQHLALGLTPFSGPPLLGLHSLKRPRPGLSPTLCWPWAPLLLAITAGALRRTT